MLQWILSQRIQFQFQASPCNLTSISNSSCKGWITHPLLVSTGIRHTHGPYRENTHTHRRKFKNNMPLHSSVIWYLSNCLDHQDYMGTEKKVRSKEGRNDKEGEMGGMVELLSKCLLLTRSQTCQGCQ